MDGEIWSLWELGERPWLSGQRLEFVRHFAPCASRIWMVNTSKGGPCTGYQLYGGKPWTMHRVPTLWGQTMHHA